MTTDERSATSVGADFPHQLDRAREILTHYESIPQGAFGAVFIRADIAEAERAFASGDMVAIIRAYAKLKEIK